MTDKDKTNEFSFILKPAKYGIGVFAAHDIKTGTYLKLFHEENEPSVGMERKKKDVPKYFRQYCLDRGEMLWAPKDFGRMEIGWHLNHSKTPNAINRNYKYYAQRDILEGEEITIDYNSLEEPENAKADYYR
jgi:SET domain-containing protein